MTADSSSSFVTYYIQSLCERTRDEKRSTKFGFDWVIYNIAITEEWTPQRLPFLRSGAAQTSSTKTEPEFGVDFAFLSLDGKSLRIFVLKDEVLNNRNWGRHSFDIDIRNASTPDLSGADMREVEVVEVILAYNKDEDQTGIKLFENLTKGLGTKICDTVTLTFDRWNLTKIVEKVQRHLLSPALLPQKFFSHFSYICAQFADFRHGSDEWCNQLIPNWRRFLQELLSERADERCIRLLPVALLILQEHGRSNPTAETAWIDLIEWGMLSAWNVARNSSDEVAIAVAQMWIAFYLAELDRYYALHSENLAVRFSLDKPIAGGFLDAIASAVAAHWHLARLGLLGVSYYESLPKGSKQEQEARTETLITISEWVVGLINGNPSALRPLVDLHHIEMFLVWGSLMQVGRAADVCTWLTILTNRLAMRRTGLAELPFIEGHNSIDLVLEFVATGKKPDEFCDGSSVFLTCLMELVCALPPEQRDELLQNVYRRLVAGRTDEGSPIDGVDPLTLMLWIPPKDWGDRVLVKSLSDEGECASIHFGGFQELNASTGRELFREINQLVSETRTKREFRFPERIPFSVIVLACLKHRTPLPPEAWRRSIFRASEKDDIGDHQPEDRP